MNQNYAPITLFVYNRPDHTRRTVEALQQNVLSEESHLVVYSDAPKLNTHAEKVREVRQYIRQIHGFKTVTVIERETNFGLANSIIDGVTRVCSEYGRVIVVEDDLVTSPFFLQYMNGALEIYENDEAVASIHGYWYPVDQPMPETFFLRGADCWGWATWSRSWKSFESDGSKLLNELLRQKLTSLFDLDGSISYTKMLRDQIAGRNNSWAIRWSASVFLANCLQLSPGKSLVRNIGFDGTGTHCSASHAFNSDFAEYPIKVERKNPEESSEARAALIRYYRSSKRHICLRILSRINRLTHNIFHRLLLLCKRYV